MNQLTIGGIVTNSIQLALKNGLSVVGAVILWAITIWIPYLNVGTTIALIGMVVAISKGDVVSPTEIFDAKYRRNMGEFFLLFAFLQMGIIAGFIFIIIPGIVISLAWGQSIYLLIDKNMNPTEAISTSNKITYGKKWTIFFGNLIIGIGGYVAIFLIGLIITQISAGLAAIASLCLIILLSIVLMSASAYIYGELSKQLDEPEKQIKTD